jgi:tight adherence protein C
MPIMESLSAQQLMVLGLISLTVMLGIAGIAMIVIRSTQLRERVDSVGKGRLPISSNSGNWLTNLLGALVEPFAKLAKPNDTQEISGMRAKFARAGWRGTSTIGLFFGLKAIVALLLPFVVLITVRISGVSIVQSELMFALLACAAIGYYIPNYWLARTQRIRQQAIFEAFPDAIDLMVVCVEAGLGLDMAIARTAKEMAVRSEALADEMNLIGIELRMGATRERALRNFATRTGVSEISMFAAMVLQADRFGTSVADALRIHSDELRLRRRLRAEETAAKIPLKLLFPLIFMIFPSLLLVLLGPAFIQITNGLKGVAGN